MSANTACAQKLDAKAFAEKLSTDTAAVVLDVRTEKEFNESHIGNAVNVNVIDEEFLEKIKNTIPRNKTIYAYCLSGGRSSQAARILRAEGYTVYDLKGGILKWRSAGLEESKTGMSITDTGLTSEAFAGLIVSQEKVLVDFYAEWCAPCKLMEPFLNEIDKTKKDELKVVRIDVDKNESLAQALKVDALPVLHLYENGKMKWEHLGFINKKDLLKKLRL